MIAARLRISSQLSVETRTPNASNPTWTSTKRGPMDHKYDIGMHELARGTAGLCLCCFCGTQAPPFFVTALKLSPNRETPPNRETCLAIRPTKSSRQSAKASPAKLSNATTFRRSPIGRRHPVNTLCDFLFRRNRLTNGLLHQEGPDISPLANLAPSPDFQNLTNAQFGILCRVN